MSAVKPAPEKSVRANSAKAEGGLDNTPEGLPSTNKAALISHQPPDATATYPGNNGQTSPSLPCSSATPVSASNKKFSPITNGRRAAFLSVVKEMINGCSDLSILGEIQECVRQKINISAKEQKRIKHITTEVKKVDQYTYRKKQTKEDSPSYWYIHYTVRDSLTRRSRTVTRYLGKEVPTFIPKVDLQRAEKKRLTGRTSTPRRQIKQA